MPPSEQDAAVVSLARARRRRRTREAADDARSRRHDAVRRDAVDASIWALHRRSPELSAVTTLSRGQRIALGLLAAAVLVAVGAHPRFTFTVLVAVVTMMYAAAVAFRLALCREALHAPAVFSMDDDEARRLPDHELPSFTVMVAAYKEGGVVAGLLAALDELDYPRDRLEVKLLLEEDDDETIDAAVAASPKPYVEIVRVPAAHPRTKPKALNYGLLSARGELVTIYDAEDRPEPLQLRRAAAALRRAGPDVACVQAKLIFHNPSQNIITKWFTAEYAMWFSHLLPGLVRRRMPLPLGGTSNHFRTAALLDAGAWDPFNVTEDADLGIRLHRLGWRVEVLDSLTHEEANSDFVNWVKQRSRWYKGYLQTWLVHMRRPRRLWRELGPSGFLAVNLFVGGTPLLALVNPVFWTMTAVWFTLRPAAVEAVFPGWLYYLSLLSWALGNFSLVYTSVVSARAAGRPELIGATLLSPLYWVMMSLAAVKAAVQLVAMPSYWEKTTHGLGSAAEAGAEGSVAS